MKFEILLLDGDGGMRRNRGKSGSVQCFWFFRTSLQSSNLISIRKMDGKFHFGKYFRFIFTAKREMGGIFHFSQFIKNVNFSFCAELMEYYKFIVFGKQILNNSHKISSRKMCRLTSTLILGIFTTFHMHNFSHFLVILSFELLLCKLFEFISFSISS